MAVDITIGAVWKGAAAFSSAINAVNILQESCLSLHQKTLSLTINTDALDEINDKINLVDNAITSLNSRTMTLNKVDDGSQTEESITASSEKPSTEQNTSNTIAKSLNAINGSISSALNTINTSITTPLNMVNDSISNAFSTINESITTPLNAIKDSVFTTFNSVNDTISSSLSTIDDLKSTYGKAKESVQLLRNPIGQLKNTVAFTNAKMLIATMRTKMLSVSQRIGAASSSLLTINLKSLGAAFTLANLKMKAASVATKLLSAGQWLLNVALAANPIGLTIATVAAGALLVYKYWQPISAFLGGVFDGFMSAIDPLKTALQPLFSFLSPLGAVFAWIGDTIGYVANWFTTLLTPVNMASEQLEGFASTGEMIGAVIGNVFTLMLLPITTAIKAIGMLGTALSSVGDFLGFGEEEATIENSKTNQKDNKASKKSVKKNVITSIAKPISTVSKAVATGVITTQLAASPLPPETQVTESVIPVKNASLQLKTTPLNPQIVSNKEQQQSSSQKPTQVTQNITMHVAIHNPTSTVEVEQAISNAMAKQATSLTDEEI